MKLRTKTKSSVEKLSLEFEFDTRKEFDIFCDIMVDMMITYERAQISRYMGVLTSCDDCKERLPNHIKAYLTPEKENIKTILSNCFKKN